MVTVQGPTDARLRPAWALAVVKVERRLGRAPSSAEEWNAVTEEYGRLTRKHLGIPVRGAAGPSR